MEVTKDDLELPLVVADTEQELATICGVTKANIGHLVQKRREGKRTRFVVVEIEEEYDGGYFTAGTGTAR